MMVSVLSSVKKEGSAVGFLKKLLSWNFEIKETLDKTVWSRKNFCLQTIRSCPEFSEKIAVLKFEMYHEITGTTCHSASFC